MRRDQLHWFTMSTRRRQQEDVDEAYEIQSKAAIQVCPRSRLV